MELLERFEACKGMPASAISEVFASDDFDEVSQGLLTILAERTDVRRLPQVPFTVRVTFYGDEDVHDSVIRYERDSYQIDPPTAEDVLDAHLRWEHWEDAVRLINADMPASTVLFSFRVTFDGQKEGGRKRTAALAWMAAVNFANQRPEERAGGYLYRLQWLTVNDPDRIPAYVAEVGLQAIVRSRAEVMGRTFVEVGAKDEVAGSYLRFDVVADPPAAASVAWDAETGETTVTEPEFDSVDNPDDGVTLRYLDEQTFLDVAGLKVLPMAAMASGKVVMRASPERAANYQKAMMYLARHVP